MNRCAADPWAKARAEVAGFLTRQHATRVARLLLEIMDHSLPATRNIEREPKRLTDSKSRTESAKDRITSTAS
jgi:hypothetical protein